MLRQIVAIEIGEIDSRHYDEYKSILMKNRFLRRTAIIDYFYKMGYINPEQKSTWQTLEAIQNFMLARSEILVPLLKCNVLEFVRTALRYDIQT